MAEPDVTICMTMGLRPQTLRKTIESLGPNLRQLPIIAVNDFGDEETNAAYRDLCPHGKLVSPGVKLGHHRAIDAIYQYVETPFIFHMEDDWGFWRDDFLEPAKAVLTASDAVSMVVLRDISDMRFSPEREAGIVHEDIAGHRIKRLDQVHPHWFRYTFNPHVTRLSQWQDLGGFAQFEGERNVSKHFLKLGKFCAFADPGACKHIGQKISARKGRVKAGKTA